MKLILIYAGRWTSKIVEFGAQKTRKHVVSITNQILNILDYDTPKIDFVLDFYPFVLIIMFIALPTISNGLNFNSNWRKASVQTPG